jgi:hypothetical protein
MYDVHLRPMRYRIIMVKVSNHWAMGRLQSTALTRMTDSSSLNVKNRFYTNKYVGEYQMADGSLPLLLQLSVDDLRACRRSGTARFSPVDRQEKNGIVPIFTGKSLTKC